MECLSEDVNLNWEVEGEKKPMLCEVSAKGTACSEEADMGFCGQAAVAGLHAHPPSTLGLVHCFSSFSL